MYESAHFISSRDMSGFYDYPMPKSFADYPTRKQILNTRSPSPDDFGLVDGIEFNNGVARVEEDGDGWLVTTRRRHNPPVQGGGLRFRHELVPGMPQHLGGIRR